LTSVYALPAIFLDPVLGIVADRVGRKRLVITASLIFGAAFTACAFARSFEQLLIFRFIQGMGGAGLRSLPLASPNYLGTTMSANGSSFGLGLVFGPLLAGLIVGTAGINSVFFVGTGISFTATLVLANNVRSQWVGKSLR
jgi:ACDE family multidrug resistance protein